MAIIKSFTFAGKKIQDSGQVIPDVTWEIWTCDASTKLPTILISSGLIVGTTFPTNTYGSITVTLDDGADVGNNIFALVFSAGWWGLSPERWRMYICYGLTSGASNYLLYDVTYDGTSWSKSTAVDPLIGVNFYDATSVLIASGGILIPNDGYMLNQYSNYKFGALFQKSLPNKPINPTPTNAATNVTLHQTIISWEDGGGATSYNVYYGVNEAGLTLVSSGQAGLSFTVWGITNGSPYDYSTSRTWRIDAVNEAGTTTGNVWSFTTISLKFPQPGSSGGEGGGMPDGSPSGANNMLTIKRFVAIAANKLWFESS